MGLISTKAQLVDDANHSVVFRFPADLAHIRRSLRRQTGAQSEWTANARNDVEWDLARDEELSLDISESPLLSVAHSIGSLEEPVYEVFGEPFDAITLATQIGHQANGRGIFSIVLILLCRVCAFL